MNDIVRMCDICFDKVRFDKDVRIRRLQSNVANQIRDYADKFDELFG